MLICKNLNIEAKRSKLMFNCESSEKANMFILKNLNIEAKRTGSIVILYLKKTKKNELSFFFKQRTKNERVR
jgi:hypothetical protein